MAEKKMNNATLEGVRIVFRNFSGEEGRYNRKGDRNFCILLTDDMAEQMDKDGWHIRWLKPRNEDEEPQAYLLVAVNYGGRPPRVVMVTSRGKTHLSEDMVDILDWADVRECDVIVRPYQWEVNGKTGVKAYLQALYATIEEDYLERKYADVPDSAQNSIGSYLSDEEGND